MFFDVMGKLLTRAGEVLESDVTPTLSDERARQQVAAAASLLREVGGVWPTLFAALASENRILEETLAQAGDAAVGPVSSTAEVARDPLAYNAELLDKIDIALVKLHELGADETDALEAIRRGLSRAAEVQQRLLADVPKALPTGGASRSNGTRHTSARRLHHQLTPPDELYLHQTTDVFGSVVTSDLNWRERCWLPAHDKSGETVICLGLGNYPNRNVQEAFAAIAHRGRQHTVRMTRELDRDAEVLTVGPFGMEIVEPLKTLRLTMDENPSGIAYDLTWTGTVRAHVQAPLVQRWRGRTLMDITRFFQSGTIEGVVSVPGEEIVIDPADWVATRDKSWGVRLTADRGPAPLRPREPDLYVLFVARFERYSVFCCIREPWSEIGGVHGEDEHSRTGGFMYPFDSERHEERIRDISHCFRFDPAAPIGNFDSGELDVTLSTGETRHISVRPLPGGFHLAPGYGYPGWHQGEWKGTYHAEHSVIDLLDLGASREAGFVTKTAEFRCGDDIGYGVIEFMPTRAVADQESRPIA